MTVVALRVLPRLIQLPAARRDQPVTLSPERHFGAIAEQVAELPARLALSMLDRTRQTGCDVTTRSRATALVLEVAGAAPAPTTTGNAGNSRLAVGGAVSATAVSLPRVRYATVVAVGHSRWPRASRLRIEILRLHGRQPRQLTPRYGSRFAPCAVHGRRCGGGKW
jgi:hypothetical protein